jgi:hypothetical protein
MAVEKKDLGRNLENMKEFEFFIFSLDLFGFGVFKD